MTGPPPSIKAPAAKRTSVQASAPERGTKAANARPTTRKAAKSAVDRDHQRALESAARFVQALHDDWAEAVAQHTVRIEAQFREVQRHLRRRDLGRATPTRAQADAVRERVGALQVKPKRGRGKDLRDVERALQAILKGMPQSDE